MFKNFSINQLLHIPQIILPHHALSRLVGLLAASNFRFIKKPFIRLFINYYKVNMSEAAQQEDEFKNFNEFFTRKLKPEARPITSLPKGIACPADGTLSQFGNIQQNRLIQAKSREFTLNTLLGNDQGKISTFRNGKFATVYLSPKDYHRVHMPLSGTLTNMTYIPGKLFSVNERTTQMENELFARNERMIAYFETDFGPMAVIMVGAMIVAGINTVWSGTVTPNLQSAYTVNYTGLDQPVFLEKGEELGRFLLGSTVILLFPKDRIQWGGSLQQNGNVKMGQLFGETL